MTMLSWFAGLLATLAFLLGFSRHRLLLVAAVLGLVVAARIDGDRRMIQASLAFSPLLWPIAAVMPEARWRSKWNAGWLLLLAVAVLISLHAPTHVIDGLGGFLIGLWPGRVPVAVRWEYSWGLPRSADFAGSCAAP